MSGKKQAGCVACGVCSCIGFIALILIGFGSYQRVFLLNYGLHYDGASRQLDKDKLYTPGLYAVGIMSSFVNFPSHQLAVIFKSVSGEEDDNQAFPINAFRMDSMKSLTMDGLEIKCDIVANYKLGTTDDVKKLAEELYELHMRYMGKFERAVALAIESAVLEVFSTFTAEQVYLERKRLSTEVNDKVSIFLKNILCRNTMINIVNMDLPQRYMTAIVETQIAKQKIQETTYLKEGEQVKADSDVELAAIDKDIKIAKAIADGTIYKNIETAKGQAYKIKFENLRDAFIDLKTNHLQWTTVKEKLFVEYIMAMKLSKGTKVLYMKNFGALQKLKEITL